MSVCFFCSLPLKLLCCKMNLNRSARSSGPTRWERDRRTQRRSSKFQNQLKVNVRKKERENIIKLRILLHTHHKCGRCYKFGVWYFFSKHVYMICNEEENTENTNCHTKSCFFFCCCSFKSYTMTINSFSKSKCYVFCLVAGWKRHKRRQWTNGFAGKLLQICISVCEYY